MPGTSTFVLLGMCLGAGCYPHGKNFSSTCFTTTVALENRSCEKKRPHGFNSDTSDKEIDLKLNFFRSSSVMAGAGLHSCTTLTATSGFRLTPTLLRTTRRRERESERPRITELISENSLEGGTRLVPLRFAFPTNRPQFVKSHKFVKNQNIQFSSHRGKKKKIHAGMRRMERN